MESLLLLAFTWLPNLTGIVGLPAIADMRYFPLLPASWALLAHAGVPSDVTVGLPADFRAHAGVQTLVPDCHTVVGDRISYRRIREIISDFWILDT
jgi:hypothetical protein